ncbi:MAG: efflux RND transporter periplasmic adaptor subunit [Bacteroidaceae bacterium]|nr:efflux RND transporter periplasmic adaptor subunit [Bacteroidaceae bacterium]
MDKLLEKKPWYIRHRYYLAGGAAILALIVLAILLSAGPKKLRVDGDELKIGEAKTQPFREYVDVEGLVRPILTLKVNARESGSVLRIVAEDGQSLKKGDTIMVLTNPELEQSIEDQRDDLARQHTSYQEQLIEQEKMRLNLKKQALQTRYDMDRLEKNIQLDREENRMGIKSKAQLQVAEDEYRYNQERSKLELQSLRNDSSSAVLKGQLLARDMEREQKKYQRSMKRLESLVITAPCDGQLSYISVTPGQHVVAGESIAEVKVLDDFKVHASLSEYYIDRITSGLPATISYQSEKFPLHITKVVPEVKDRTFEIDLVFEKKQPENIRVGKSYRVQIELGKAEQALVIPRGSFYQNTAGQWIYKLDKSGKKAVRTPITIGRQNPSQYEILEGLAPGDKVITTGYDKFGDSEVIILD